VTDTGHETTTKAFTLSDDDGEISHVVFAASMACARADNGGATVRRAPEFDSHAPGPVPLKDLMEAGWYAYCSNHGCQRKLSLGDDDTWAPPPGDPRIVEEQRLRITDERRRDAWLSANPRPEEDHPDDDWKTKADKRRAREEWSRSRPHDSHGPMPERLDVAGLRFSIDGVFCSLACEQGQARDVLLKDAEHEAGEAEAERRWPNSGPYRSGRWPQTNVDVSFRPPGLEHHVRWKPGDDFVSVSKVDLDAWDAYKAQITDGDADET
jgi:hypothetical protein